MKKILFLLSFTFNVAFSQGYLTLSGKVIDKNKQPIAFAHIGINGKGIGTQTNKEGTFLFRFPRLLNDSTLRVAVVGYRKFTQKISSFQPNQKDIVIELETARPQVMDSSFVKRFDAQGLVVGAIAKIKKMASATPYMLSGFYTESLQHNNDYLEIREATLQAEKDPSPKIEVRERVKSVKTRMFAREDRAKALEGYSFPNGASIVTHSIDMGVPEYLDGKSLYEYNFQADDTIPYYHDKSVYQIRFWPMSPNIKGGRKGVMSINEADSAIVSIEYEFTASGMKDILKTTTADKVFGKTKREPKRLYTKINYMPVLGKYYLQDYRLLLDTEFEVSKTQSIGTIELHYITTDIQKSTGERITDADVLLTTDDFPLVGIPKYDDNFWGAFNFVPATGLMKEILKK